MQKILTIFCLILDLIQANSIIFEGYSNFIPPYGWAVPIVSNLSLPLQYEISFDFYEETTNLVRGKSEFEIKLGGDYYNDRVEDLPSITFFRDAGNNYYIELALRVGSLGDSDFSRNALYIDVAPWGDRPNNFSSMKIAMLVDHMVVILDGKLVGIFDFQVEAGDSEDGCFQTFPKQTYYKCDRNIQKSKDYVARPYVKVPGYFWQNSQSSAFMKNLKVTALD